jgi:hypothetical protein
MKAILVSSRGVCLAVILAAVALMAPVARSGAAEPSHYFVIKVVDEQTGRGVPLVELETVNNIRYWTDSGGLAAIYEPGLMGLKVFFKVKSQGYEFPADGFGMRGKAFELKEGGEATLKIKRLNIAERLYRVTGGGIYRDTILAGRAAPIAEPLLDGQVFGQDTVQSVIYRDKIYWFWGDTNRPSYPLGHFGTSGAVSDLPGKGGLDPSVGINLTYFVDKSGFSRPMCDVPGKGMKWIDAMMLLKDEHGQERLLSHYEIHKSLGEVTERGLIIFDDKAEAFEPFMKIPDDAPLVPAGHPFRYTAGGTEYYYFPTPYATVRVRADMASVKDLSTYEAFTCLAAGSPYEKGNSRVDRDAAGKLVWGWKKATGFVNEERQRELIKSGKMKDVEAWFRIEDVETHKPVMLHGGSMTFNAFRKRWIMVAVQSFGKASFLGEVWYTEADTPEGPWRYARQIVTHDRYSFYNPKHHPFFDQEGGRLIYFDGTYATTFSREGDATPRYDYNQVMYRLDLSDPRLALPQGKM